MAEIIAFPTKKARIKYDFADVVECAFCVTAVNLWGNMYNKPLASPHNLHEFEPAFVLDCVQKSATSNVFSATARHTFSRIGHMIQAQI